MTAPAPESLSVSEPTPLLTIKQQLTQKVRDNLLSLTPSGQSIHCAVLQHFVQPCDLTEAVRKRHVFFFSIAVQAPMDELSQGQKSVVRQVVSEIFGGPGIFAKVGLIENKEFKGLETVKVTLRLADDNTCDDATLKAFFDQMAEEKSGVNGGCAGGSHAPRSDAAGGSRAPRSDATNEATE